MKKIWYLVKWKGFSKCTWEPEENVAGCEDFIDNFLIKEESKLKEGNEDLMSAALFVEAAEDEDDGRPPQDGMAYLRQVIKERKRVPDTITAEVSQKKKPKINRVETEKSGDDSKRNDRVKVPPPPGTCPGSTWQREQMAQFSEVRLKVF